MVLFLRTIEWTRSNVPTERAQVLMYSSLSTLAIFSLTPVRQQQNPSSTGTPPSALIDSNRGGGERRGLGGNGDGSAPQLETLSVPSQPSSPSQQPDSSGGTMVGPGGAIISPPRSPGTISSTLPPIGGTVIGTGGGTVIGGSSVIDPRRPVSRLSMVQPKQNTANPPLFPVGSNIIFEWAFDNTTLVFPPTNLTIEISLSGTTKMVWPVANVSGLTTSVVWNTATVTSPALFMGFYTLNVYDTNIGKQGIATSGHLMPFSDLQFGLYIPEPYIPRTGAFCQTCSSGSQVVLAGGLFQWVAIAFAFFAATWSPFQ
ncbi:hypothetical protein BC939DRAFT_444217 [Gamsiella multidivaricata]|uniref:uncharacterized protein n=1 Tax=Gamsiella multidivaricata TaxID=101098 RepID=UPI00221E91FF|nr:uncharacterized protein BC939DRAFT_444217 [Gamsiella multidivaricata]KAI7827983.1 hypothetical protein BC939DRAFT_444217 [Gamsiella multidivaricata]